MLGRFTRIAMLAAVLTLCLAPNAGAAPRQLVHTSRYVEFLAADGNNAYWSAEGTVHRTDLTSGADAVIFESTSGYVNDLAANAGRVAIRVHIARGSHEYDRVVVGDGTSEAFPVVMTASSRFYARSSCGSALSLGNITESGSVIVAKSLYRRTKAHCKGRIKAHTQVFAIDAPADPRFPPPPRLLRDSRMSFGSMPRLAGDRLLLQNGISIEVDQVGGAQLVRKRAARNRLLFADMDPNGNLLVDDIVPGGTPHASRLYSAATNYIAGVLLTTVPEREWFYVCGERRLLDVRYAKSSSLTAIPNPFGPPPPAPAQPIVPGTTTDLGIVACDGSRAVFATLPTNGTTLYAEDLAG